MVVIDYKPGASRAWSVWPIGTGHSILIQPLLELGLHKLTWSFGHVSPGRDPGHAGAIISLGWPGKPWTSWMDGSLNVCLKGQHSSRQPQIKSVGVFFLRCVSEQ